MSQKNCWLLFSFLLLFSGCLSFVTEDDLLKKMPFERPLVYDGFYIDKAGRYFQTNMANQLSIFELVRSGMKDSLLKSRIFTFLFTNESQQTGNTPLTNMLKFKAYSDLLIAEKKDDTIKIVIRLAIIINILGEESDVVYHRKYQITVEKKDFWATESNLFYKALRVILYRIIKDLSIGDFDNPSYSSIRPDLIEVSMPQNYD